MTTLFAEDFDKICRCCLCKNGEMRPLFGSCIDNMLRFVAEIDVHAGDGLPELMCVPCVLQVSRAFTFKQQCQRSDQTLRSYLGQIPEIETENNNFQENFKDTETNSAITFEKAEKSVTNNSEECEQFDGIDETAADHIDSQIDLDSLPAEIESNSFEEDIELSNLPGSVAGDEIQQHLGGDNELITDAAVKGENGDYFDQIKLDVGHVDDIQDQSIDATFDDIPVVESDIDAKKITTNFIDDILSTENSQAAHLNKAPESTSNQPNSTTVTITSGGSTENGKKNAYHECPECHKVFSESKILRRHLKIHSPIKPHRCPECSMSFAESSNLTKHMKKHTGELRAVQGKPNLCSVCGKGFKWASSLSKHMKHHTRHKILTCPYCPKYYVETRSLNIHLRSHTGEKPFTCSVCNKGFTQAGNLEKHIRVHTGEKPYACPMAFCNKSFSQSGYVAIHLRTHTGERPYRCDFENCGRAFAGSNTLAIHKRTHTGERPFRCTVSECGKTFARQETANIHMRTHSGEKPYTCKICSRGFTSSGHLTGHIRTHSHNGTSKTHECKICQKRFAGSSSLKVHMKSHVEKADQQQQQQQQEHQQIEQQQIFDDKTTIFECDMCKMNIPSSVLTSPDELQAYNHEFIDDVLICSNVASIIDDGKMIEEIHDENGTNIILTTATDMQNGQQLLINLSDLK